MTWMDNKGELRPSDWDEYCQMVRDAGDWEATQRLMRLHGPRFVSPRSDDVPRERERPLKIPRKPEPRMRLRLFRANPFCFWCGCGVVLEVDQPSRPDLATVDHLYSRWHPDRELNYQRQRGVLHVLACRICNGERASAEQDRRPFVPKLPERLEFAQRADASLAKGLPAPKEGRPLKGLCTIEEAITFARERHS